MTTQESVTSTDNIARLKTMEQGEPIASFLGMRLVELAPGYARVIMKLKPEYRTFNGMVFGGMIMAVADQAFAYAVNSLAHPSISVDFHIHHLCGPGAEDELVAECRVVHRGGRVSFAEAKVSNQEGKLIATASGITVRVNQS